MLVMESHTVFAYSLVFSSSKKLPTQKHADICHLQSTYTHIYLINPHSSPNHKNILSLSPLLGERDRGTASVIHFSVQSGPNHDTVSLAVSLSLSLSYQSMAKPGCQQRTGGSTAGQELKVFPIHLAIVVLGMLQENLVWVGLSRLQGAAV